ncbi:MAG: hypothetical protein JWQ71_3862 [Pedosphaera sp.]|nr:hypothetical protein [Pedosphaera sp.]
MKIPIQLMAYGVAISVFTQPLFAQQQPPRTEGAPQQSFEASNLIKKRVKSADGSEIGVVKDIVFNPQSGETFVLVDLGRKGMAPVPWQLISSGGGSNEKDVRVKLSKEVFNSAPTVNDKQLGNFNDPQFTQRIYAYYGVPPMAIGGAGHGLEGTEKGAGHGPSASGSNSPAPPTPPPAAQPDKKQP